MLTTLSLTVLFDLAIAIEVGLVMAIFLLFHRVQESSSIYMMGNEIDPTHGTDLTSQEKLLVPKGVEVYEIDGPFFFGMANKFDEQMSIIGDKPKVRILRMRHVPFIDSSGLHNLEDLANNCRKEEIRLILSGVTKEVQETLERSGFTTKFDKQFICENIQIALHKAHIELDRINSKKNIKSTVK